MLDVMLDIKKEAYGVKKNSPMRAVSPLAKPVFHKGIKGIPDSEIFKIPRDTSPKVGSPNVYKKVLTSTMVKPEEESFAPGNVTENGANNFLAESLMMEEFKTTNIRQVSGVFLVL